MKAKLVFSLLMINLILHVAVLKAQTKPAATIPKFTFYTMDDKPFTRQNLVANKKSIFIYFDATCEHCQNEIDSIGKNYSAFKKSTFYLISLDEKPSIKKFMETYGKDLNGRHNVIVLRDTNKEFIEKFTPNAYPAIFVYSEQGNLIKYFAGQKSVIRILNAVNN